MKTCSRVYSSRTQRHVLQLNKHDLPNVVSSVELTEVLRRKGESVSEATTTENPSRDYPGIIF